MNFRAFARGNEQVGGLLHAVVEKRKAVSVLENEPCLERFLKVLLNAFRRCVMNEGQGSNLCLAPEAGEALQGVLRRRWKPAQLGDQQIGHVIREALAANALKVPLPARGARVEHGQTLFGERGQELDHEERIAARLFIHELGQRPGLPRIAVKGIGGQPDGILLRQRGKHDGADARAAFAHLGERQHERMSGADLIVAVCANDQEVLDLRMEHQMLDKLHGRRVQPLQVVQEQHEGMPGAREYPEQAPEHGVEAILSVLRRHFLNGRLLADQSSLDLQRGW